MKKIIAAVAMLAAANGANATTYVATRTVGTMTAQLSITTDDTIGVLSSANIVDWTLKLSGQSRTATLEGYFGSENSRVEIKGAALSATATDLLFDFSLNSQAYMLFQVNDTSDISIFRSLYCVQTWNCYDQNHGEEIIGIGFLDSVHDIAAKTGVQVLASTASVPEPASWAMMIGGLGVVGAAMRRRRAVVAFA
jgi:hypothetical protein